MTFSFHFRSPACALVLCATLAFAASPAHARKPAPAAAAHASLAVAAAAAPMWAGDAQLVYLENDEVVDADGAAPRWSYLYYSPSLDASRVYSVRNGRIVVAETLDIKFAAPPLSAAWLDSHEALAIAEKHGGETFRRESGAHVAHMLLARGTFQPGQADLTTWTIVYEASGAPSLFVVVDAADGHVCRTWRG